MATFRNIQNDSELAKLYEVGEGFIYNDYSGLGNPHVTYNILHAASCNQIKRLDTKKPKFLFRTLTDAIAWLSEQRGEEGKRWRRCGICHAEGRPLSIVSTRAETTSPAIEKKAVTNPHPEQLSVEHAMRTIAEELELVAKTPDSATEIEEVIDHRIEAEALVVDEDDESAFPEGRESFQTHRHLERDGKIPSKAKAKRLAETGKLECEVCRMDFHRFYGKLGDGFIEAHHTMPVSKLNGAMNTKVSDLALVCSNCHRMLHRGQKLLSIDELRVLVNGVINA